MTAKVFFKAGLILLFVCVLRMIGPVRVCRFQSFAVNRGCGHSVVRFCLLLPLATMSSFSPSSSSDHAACIQRAVPVQRTCFMKHGLS